MSNENTQDIEAYRRVLREIADLAQHASLTGSLSGGVGRVIERYNGILETLIQMNAVPAGLFKPLPANASFDDVGIDAKLLSAQLDTSCKPGKNKSKDPSVLLRLAPFVDARDLSELVREQIRQNANFDMDLLTGLAPFMEQSMLGELLRVHIKAAHPETPAEAPTAPSAPSGPAQPTTPAADFKPASAPEAHPAKPEDLLELLKNPHLSESERADLLEQLSNSVRPK